MTNFNDDDKTITIPDFMDDKDTDSSVDMSIFKMSDDELYDDVPKKEEKKKTSKKKVNSTLVLCLVVIGFLVVALTVVSVYAFKQHSSYIADHDKATQLEAANKDLTAKVSTLDAQVITLQAKIKEIEENGTVSDPDAKYKKGAKLYITEDGSSQGVRTKASVESEVVTKDGSDYVLYWGDTVTLVEDAKKDADGNYWGKIDGGYIRIEYDGEEWATLDE